MCRNCRLIYFPSASLFPTAVAYFVLVHRYWENEKVRLAYRPVHMNTLDDEIETFPPKARVYWVPLFLLAWIQHWKTSWSHVIPVSISENTALSKVIKLTHDRGGKYQYMVIVVFSFQARGLPLCSFKCLHIMYIYRHKFCWLCCVLLVDAITTMMKELLVHVEHLIVLCKKCQFSKHLKIIYRSCMILSKAFFEERWCSWLLRSFMRSVEFLYLLILFAI